MTFEEEKKTLNAFLNEFLKKQGKSMDAVENHFQTVENMEKRRLENDIAKSESTINSSMKTIAEMKKDSDINKDEKTKQIREKEKLINELKSKIKNNSKIISKLSGNTKDSINNLRSKLKEFYKLNTGFLKILDSKIDINRLLKISEEHLNYLKFINDELKLESFILGTKLELKAKRNGKDFKIDNYDQYVALCLDTIIYYLLEAMEEEKVLNTKQLISENTIIYARGAVKHAKLVNMESTKYFESMEKLCESEFISNLAHKEFKEFNLTVATSYFLEAKKRLDQINDFGKNMQKLVSEKAKIAQAWASDAYNLIYLLNSYKYWQEVIESKNSEIREIAQITKDKVEDFITSQFGFPEEIKINNILKELRWPSSATPSVLDKIQPIH